RRMLAQSVAAGDVQRARAAIELGGDGLMVLEDLAPALRSTKGPLAAVAARAAIALAGPGDGARLCALLPPGDDDDLEAEILARARVLDAPFDRDRVMRAIGPAALPETPAAAARWAEGLAWLASVERDPAVKRLRKAAIGPDSPARAAALRA